MAAKVSNIANADTWYIKQEVHAIRKVRICFSVLQGYMTNPAKRESLPSISGERIVSELICLILRF